MEINEFVRTFGVLTNGRPTSKVVKLVRPAAPCLVQLRYEMFRLFSIGISRPPLLYYLTPFFRV